MTDSRRFLVVTVDMNGLPTPPPKGGELNTLKISMWMNKFTNELQRANMLYTAEYFATEINEQILNKKTK